MRSPLRQRCDRLICRLGFGESSHEAAGDVLLGVGLAALVVGVAGPAEALGEDGEHVVDGAGGDAGAGHAGDCTHVACSGTSLL